MKKKHLISAGLIATAAMTLACTGSAFAAVAGDVNADGTLDVKDAVAFIRYIAEQQDCADPAAGDMNGDGILNAIDLTLMKYEIVGGTGGTSQGGNNDGNETDPAVVVDETYVSQITFAADGVTLKNANDQVVDPANAQNVTVENGTYVTITKPTTDGTNNFGDINVDGVCAEGQLKVDVDETTYATGQVTFNLRGLTLSNTKDSPIYVAQIADECVITIKKDTVNTISDGTSYTNADNSAGAIYSLDDIKFKGKGTLIVNGNCGDGIVGKDDIKIWNGDIQVTAVDDGIRGKDSIRIGDPDNLTVEGGFDGLSVQVTSKNGDGLKSTNDTADSGKGYIKINGGTVTIKAENGDGIQAEQEVDIVGGTIDIYTYQGSSYSGSSSGSQNPWGGGGTSTSNLDISAKGIKAVGLYDEAGTTYQSAGNIYVTGGLVTVDSSDDCLHGAGNVYLNAGKLKLSSGDDAVHSDQTLYVGGTEAGTDYTSLEVYVTTCYEGFEATKIYQNNGNIYIISRDDGFNAAGGADSSGSGNTNPWGQGGMGGSSYGEMYLNGGIVSVNTSFQDADGFDSNGPVVFNGGYYFGNGGDSFDCGDGYSITYNGGYAFGGLGMNGGSAYDMSSQMVFADSSGNVLASSMSGSAMSYAYGNNNVLAYSGAQITDGTNISTLGQPAVYISGKVSGGTAKTLGQSSGGGQTGPGGRW